MTALVLSDVHLRDATSVKTQLVIRFLQQVASRFENLYILGDLFDAWPVTSPYLIRLFDPVIETLRGLAKNGSRITYIEGNHDFHLGAFFSESLGIRVCVNELVEDWNGRRVYMIHGDLGNPKQLGHRLFRALTRQPAVAVGLKCIPQSFLFRVSSSASHMSRRYRPLGPEVEQKIRNIYRGAAQDLFKKGYDVVMMGHTHLPDDLTVSVDGRSCRYLNTGDWVKHFTYLEFDGQEIYTKTHPLKEI